MIRNGSKSFSSLAEGYGETITITNITFHESLSRGP
jgi:hypothetical protein